MDPPTSIGHRLRLHFCPPKEEANPLLVQLRWPEEDDPRDGACMVPVQVKIGSETAAVGSQRQTILTGRGALEEHVDKLPDQRTRPLLFCHAHPPAHRLLF